MRLSKGERIFSVFNNAFMAFSTILCAAPMLYIIMASFISPDDYMSYGISFPRHFSLYNYIYLIGGKSKVANGLMINIYVTAVATALNLVFTYVCAYVISKRYLPGRVGLTFFMYFTMLFGGGIVPYYLWIKSLGLLNSLWSIILPGLISPWNCFLIRNFLMTLPESIEESARIDGANDIVILGKIILPLSTPVLATIGLFIAVNSWNGWFTALIYFNDSSLYPLQLVLRYFLANNVLPVTAEEARLRAMVEAPGDILKMTATVIAIFPILVVYPFVQKYFVKGIIAGSIKG